MPSRLIREGILTSDRVEALDFAAEVFYRRLMSKVDDYGLLDARLSTLRTSLYPLRVDRVREADIARWIATCEKAGVIALYEHGGKPYLQMLDTRWSARSEPKCPAPPWGLTEQPSAPENSCEQVKTAVPVFGDVVLDVDGKGARKRAQPFDPAAIELPSWLDRAMWLLWVEDRKARKKPISERGAAMQLAKLETFRGEGHSPDAVISHSIAGGYQGLFAPANNRSQPAAGAITTPSTDKRGDEYLAQQDQRAVEATKPPAHILALAGKIGKAA